MICSRRRSSQSRGVLNQIRNISVDRCGPQQIADVANLFAIHLVRSPAFKDFHRDIGDPFRAVDVPAFVNNPEYIERFEASEGRPPTEAELLELAVRAYDELATDPMSLVTTMIRQHDAIAEKLNGFHLQVVSLADSPLPGLVIGDTPSCTPLWNAAATGSATGSPSATQTSSSALSPALPRPASAQARCAPS